MAEALAAYQGPITKCPPGSVQHPALSASARMAKRRQTRFWGGLGVAPAGTAPLKAGALFRACSLNVCFAPKAT